MASGPPERESHRKRTQDRGKHDRCDTQCDYPSRLLDLRDGASTTLDSAGSQANTSGAKAQDERGLSQLFRIIHRDAAANHEQPRYPASLLSIDKAIHRINLSGRSPFAFFSDRRPESISKEVAGHHFHCRGIGYRITGGATITAVRGSCTTAVVTDPSAIPANRTQPWLPTSTSWGMSDRPRTRRPRCPAFGDPTRARPGPPLTSLIWSGVTGSTGSSRRCHHRYSDQRLYRSWYGRLSAVSDSVGNEPAGVGQIE